MNKYEFHPQAAIDLNAVWEFIAEDNPDAADRMIDAIEALVKRLLRFRIKVTAGPISPRVRYAS
jgi:plasmid stabilization system protein ParE